MMVAQAELTAKEPENHPVGATARRRHRERMRHKSGLGRHEAQGKARQVGMPATINLIARSGWANYPHP